MKIDDLLLLTQVQRAGSLSAGARSVGLPKATVSRRLSALEASVGARLFVPGASRLTLTELGEQLAERAARHHDDIDETRQWLASRDATPRGILRVSMPAEFAMLLLADSLARFVQRYPEVAVDIDTTPRRIDLFNEPYDLALRIGPVDEPELVARRFMTLEPGLFDSPGYLQAHPAPLSPEDLAQHRFVVLAQMLAYKARLFQAKREAAFEMRGPIQCNSIGLSLSLVRSGAGIGVFPPGMVRADLAAGSLVRLLPDWHFPATPVTLLTVSRRLMPAKTRVFIDHLFETVPDWALVNVVKPPA